MPTSVMSDGQPDLPRRDGIERGPQRDDERRRRRQERGDRRDRAVRVVDDREDRHEVADHRDHRDRGRGVRGLLHPRRQRAEEPERGRVQQVAEHEPDGQQGDRAGRRRRAASRRSVSGAAISAAVTKTTSWTTPRTPMPRTLPISRSRGPDGREDDLDDPALLLLDDAGQDREAEAEDADEDQHGADVGDQEARLVGLGLRLDAPRPPAAAGRPPARPGRRRSRPSTAWTRSATVAAEMICAVAWSGSFSKRTSPGAGQVGRHRRRRRRPSPSSSAASAAAASG